MTKTNVFTTFRRNLKTIHAMLTAEIGKGIITSVTIEDGGMSFDFLLLTTVTGKVYAIGANDGVWGADYYASREDFNAGIPDFAKSITTTVRDTTVYPAHVARTILAKLTA